jgi:hypothetical protein
MAQKNDSLFKKLLYIQEQLEVPKAQRNTFGNYNYRSCEDILEAVKPFLFELELLLCIDEELVQIGERYYIKAIVELSEGTGETVMRHGYAREEENKKGMDGSQITGAASSYAQKYALNKLFLLDDNKDSDTTNKHEKRGSTNGQTMLQLAVQLFDGFSMGEKKNIWKWLEKDFGTKKFGELKGDQLAKLVKNMKAKRTVLDDSVEIDKKDFEYYRKSQGGV